MNLQERANCYNKAFPNYPPLVTTDRWLYGMWMIGNNYKAAQGFYGEYPPTYLKRIRSLFPDKDKILHLFSGSVQDGSAITFDLVQPADVTGNAEELDSYFSAHSFNLILADPPYSQEDAEHYGTPMVNRNKVISKCVNVLEPEGFICWLDTILPMYRKIELTMVGTIGIIRSTNHRFRVVSIFQRKVSNG